MPLMLKRLIIAFLTASFWLVAPVALPTAQADTVSGCQDDLWITFGSTRRVICDGARRPDGSWLRARELYTPAHNVPLTTYCSGGLYYSSCNTSGGYWQPRTTKGIETYIVFDTNVLPDEPPHLVNGLVP